MRNNMLKTLILTALFGSIFTASAKEVFTWQERGHNAYSDTPNNLTPVQSSTFNVQTHTVTQNPPAASVSEVDTENEAEKQNKKIQAENKKIDEKNKKIDEDNKNKRNDACKTARINRQMADSIRSNNRDALIRRYEQEVDNYCN